MSGLKSNELEAEVDKSQNYDKEKDVESVVEDIDGMLESSGGSLELLQLQDSTVTFTGVPSPQPSDSFPPKKSNSVVATKPLTSNGPDEQGI